MSFQEIAKSVRAEAGTLGIRLPMAKLNDAIALACYGKKYAAAIAAEKAWQLPPVPTPPPFIAEAARQYRLDAYAFGLALRAGLEGKHPSRNDGTLDIAMDWVSTHYPRDLKRLEASEFFGLADRSLIERVLSHPGYAGMALAGFMEWVIAEALVNEKGKPTRVSDLLVSSKSRPAWNSRQRAYLRALAENPLRLYLIEEVVPGYRMSLRELGGTGELLEISERSGSRPDVQGTMLGARVISHNDHLELAGGIYQFSVGAGAALADVVREHYNDTSIVSRMIRSAWFEQFSHPFPTPVLADSGEAVRLITDTYDCPSIDVLAEKLANASVDNVEGSIELGWSRLHVGDDGKTRAMCSIHVDDDNQSQITVFYQSEGRAEKYRPWFESLAGDSVSFVSRESLDPIQAAMDMPPEAKQRSVDPRIPKDMVVPLIEQMYRQQYENWADTPIPMLDNLSPRDMLKRKPNGEARVREILGMYEANERRMAGEDKRTPVRFDFLYQQIGLATESKRISKSAGIHPDQFEVNEAWIVFRMLDGPVRTTDGNIQAIGLMDAGSTCILNAHLFEQGRDFSQIEAASFLKNLKVEAPPRPPKKLLVASNVEVGALTAEANRLGISIVRIEEDELMPIIGTAKESFGDRFDDFISRM